MKVRTFKNLFSAFISVLLGGGLLLLGINLPGMIPVTTNPNGFLGTFKAMMFAEHSNTPTAYYYFTVGMLGVAGLLIGSATGPKLTQRLINAGNAIERMSAKDKAGVFIGTFLGLMVSAPAFIFLSRWPMIGMPIALLFATACVYLGVRGSLSMTDQFMFLKGSGGTDANNRAEVSMDRCKILDTNVIIDGRIADVCRAGFIEGAIYVPGFVLEELQHIADSSDPLKRARGRRGLEILDSMQKELDLVVRTQDSKLEPIRGHEEVDAKLVRLAKALNGSIVTNDFNLNRVAGIQGVQVLNVNLLANALKPVVLPGEEMQVAIVKEGREPAQGVAYLDDGTMIVVEDGRPHIGEDAYVVVTTVLQTVAGKMIFARMRGPNGDGGNGTDNGRNRPGGGPRNKIR